MWIPGKGTGILQNFQSFRARVWKCYRTHRNSGYCGTVIQNSQKFRAGTKTAVPVPRVLWHGADRTHRSSGYGHECPTETHISSGYGYESLAERPEVPGIVAHGRTELTQVPGKYKNAAPLPRVLWHGRTHLTEVPGTGMIVVQNSQKFFARVWMLYRTHRSSRYG